MVISVFIAVVLVFVASNHSSTRYITHNQHKLSLIKLTMAQMHITDTTKKNLKNSGIEFLFGLT